MPVEEENSIDTEVDLKKGDEGCVDSADTVEEGELESDVFVGDEVKIIKENASTLVTIKI